jgi:hypothetical protein
MKKIMLGLAAVGLVIAFQNCSNGASFQSAGDLVAKADGGSADPATDGVNAGDGATGPAASPTPVVTAPNYPPKDLPGTLPPGHTGDDDCDRDDHGHHHEHVQGHNKSDMQFVCVLEGHGKSVKVGLLNKSLVGQNGTPSDVCMTENACLNIIAKKFSVKSAEKRGFCKNKSAHVVTMTDVEIEASLAETELMKSLGGVGRN